ncbi:hypothetical protein [Micrococcus sp.]|uniref:hypothetical protein n=1 Tax=Micrococcus sp. TaxID=1271 RepID=UPI0026DBD1C6|nr:hypothetical protein [Micrococcus sp.]MDO4240022.1 hypothetical protein [Micrococcus sp.]
MIRSLLLLGTGTAAGWLAHRATETGRRAAEQEAGRRVRETLDPTRLGRSAGQAVGDAAAEAVAQSAQAFTERLRADAPPWVSQLLGPAVTIVPGETAPGPGEARHPGERTRPSPSARMTIPGEAVDAPAAPTTPKDPNA